MPSNPTGSSVATDLLDVIVRLNRWVNQRTAWALPLTLPQARMLSQIQALGTPRVSDLAQAEHCSQPTVTTQVHRLQAQGLVARRPDPDDARSVRLFLTESGRRALTEARRVRAEIVETVFNQLAAADRQRLQDALAALSVLLEAARQSPSSS